jgi:hypothetical protein
VSWKVHAKESNDKERKKNKKCAKLNQKENSENVKEKD